MLDYEITVKDGEESILCLTCERRSYSPEDVYFRYCPGCGMLGESVRAKWINSRSLLRELCDHYGRYKMVIGVDGVRRRVPTEWILTEGIGGSDLAKFPEWEGEG